MQPALATATTRQKAERSVRPSLSRSSVTGGSGPRAFYKHTAPLGQEDRGLGPLQTYCPAGAGGSGLRASTNILPRWGRGIGASGFLQTYAPLGQEDHFFLFSLDLLSLDLLSLDLCPAFFFFAFSGSRIKLSSGPAAAFLCFRGLSDLGVFSRFLPSCST